MYQESDDTYFKNKNSKFHDNYQRMICWFWEHNLLQNTQKKNWQKSLSTTDRYISMYQGKFDRKFTVVVFF